MNFSTILILGLFMLINFDAFDYAFNYSPYLTLNHYEKRIKANAFTRHLFKLRVTQYLKEIKFVRINRIAGLSSRSQIHAVRKSTRFKLCSPVVFLMQLYIYIHEYIMAHYLRGARNTNARTPGVQKNNKNKKFQ